jgi:hypothetical protein
MLRINSPALPRPRPGGAVIERRWPVSPGSDPEQSRPRSPGPGPPRARQGAPERWPRQVTEGLILIHPLPQPRVECGMVQLAPLPDEAGRPRLTAVAVRANVSPPGVGATGTTSASSAVRRAAWSPQRLIVGLHLDRRIDRPTAPTAEGTSGARRRADAPGAGGGVSHPPQLRDR